MVTRLDQMQQAVEQINRLYDLLAFYNVRLADTDPKLYAIVIQ
ncbi:MAG: hypothetical protein AB1758_34505 [Candidatus Eremiobacterota bacterium]